MYKTIKLTKRTAAVLIGRIYPNLNIRKDNTPPNVVIFRASTGREGLEIICENDWCNYDGRIRLTISDGGNCLVRCYHPETLERDYAAEESYREDAAREARVKWVSDIGREKAHKLVDQYWEG